VPRPTVQFGSTGRKNVVTELSTLNSEANIWPSAAWRPGNDTSPFNKLIPASPSIYSGSADAITKLLVSVNGPGHILCNQLTGESTFHTVVYSGPNDPEYTINVTGFASEHLDGQVIRIPEGTVPTDGSDGHLCVVDPSTGWAYDLYESTTPSGSGGTLDVYSGGVSKVDTSADATLISLDLDEDGTFGGATAAQVGLLAGIIRAEEMEAGEINHALFITIPCGSPDPEFVAPATKGGTFCGDNIDRIPMGARLWLDMTESAVNALSVPTWKKTILHAMRRYGMYFMDTGGPSAFGIHIEADETYSAFGETPRMITFADANSWTVDGSDRRVGIMRTGVTWTNLKILDWDDPDNY
jgi:hypothetical protein